MRRTEVAPADTERVIDIVCQEIDNAADRVTSASSWATMEAFFLQCLVHRRSIDAAVMIAWADAGHPAADRALRRYTGEMKDQGRYNELLVQVKAYDVRVSLRPFLPYPQGRHVVQNLMRNIWLPLVVQRVAEGTGLAPTRSASTVEPSAAYFVALAMKRRGIKIKEQEISRIYWNRDKVAGALEASMPAIPLEAA